MTGQKKIYIILSGTNTRFAKCIRRFGHTKYNHASVSLDKSLSKMYGFARPQHNAIFCGRLVKESADRFTLRKALPVPIMVFEIPVEEEQYDYMVQFIKEIYYDKEYLYNLFSVLSYPVTNGFATYKAYTCVEFVMVVLAYLGFRAEKPFYQYKPDELITLLQEYQIYQGDIRGYVDEVLSADDSYFAPMSLRVFKWNALNFFSILKRSVF